MLVYVLRRLIGVIPTMLLVTLTVFIIMRITPGGPAVAVLGEQATPQAVAALNHKLGLDRPLYIQYLDWLGHALRGDLGRSISGNQPVTELIVQRIMPTAELGFLSMMIALLIGITGGVIAATRHNTGVDAASSVLSILGVSTPSFWLAILLVLIVSIKIHWLPSLGYVSPFKDPAMNLKQMILPSFTLGVTLAAVIARITRGSMLDALYQDFVRTARAKGLHERHVVMQHALANALIPVVTVVGVQIAGLLGGAVIIETIFALPGNGQLLVTSIFSRDLSVVQGIVVVIALAFTLINLLVDVLYAALDPQIRLS
jgi:peptide/nickel transport system permease protein